jgi:hypothetical protein
MLVSRKPASNLKYLFGYALLGVMCGALVASRGFASGNNQRCSACGLNMLWLAFNFDRLAK